MRARIELQPIQSPIAKTFSDISARMASRNAAQDEYYAQQAEKLRRDNEIAAQQGSALEEAPKRIAEIIGKYNQAGSPVVPWRNPDTGENIENTSPDIPLEDPAAASTRRQVQSAALMASLPKEAQEGMKTGLAIGNMYGSPDDMRRGAAISGQAGALSPNWSPTAAEGNRIESRNTQNKILEEKAKPGTFNPMVYRRADGSSGTTVDGKTDFHTGAPVPPGPVVPASVQAASMDSGGFTTAAKTDLQKKGIAEDELMAFINDVYEPLVKNAPDDAFGLTGKGQMLVGDIATQVQNVAPVLQKLGFVVDPGKGDIFTQALTQAKDEAIAKGLPADQAEALFAGVNPQHQLQAMNALLRYKGAAALAGQEGRALALGDLQILEPVTPDPLGATGSKAKTLQSFQLLRKIIGASQGARPAMPGGAPAPAAPGAGRDPTLLIMQARQAIDKGAPREKVLQRLQQSLPPGTPIPGDM